MQEENTEIKAAPTPSSQLSPSLQSLFNDLNDRAIAERKAKGACPICNGTQGFLLADGETAQRCSCLKTRDLHGRYAKANIPSAYWDLSMKDWDLEHSSYGELLTQNQKDRKQFVARIMTKYMDTLLSSTVGVPMKIKYRGGDVRQLHSVLLAGDSGSGKSFLAAETAKAAVRLGLTVHFFDWDILAPLLADWNQKTEMSEVCRQWEESALIVVDGFDGRAQNLDYFSEQISRLMALRKRSGCPTVVTSSRDGGWSNVPPSVGDWIDSFFLLPLPKTPKPERRSRLSGY